MVGANLVNAQMAEVMAGGHFILVKQDFFSMVQAALFPAVDRILLALFVAVIVKVSANLLRHRSVTLLDTASHLLKKCGLQCLGVPHDGGGILILRFEIAPHRGVFTLTEPEIIINPDVTLRFNALGLFSGYGCA